MRQNIMRNIFFALLLMNVYGCVALLAGVAGGAGTASWLSGKVVHEVNAPRDKVLKASRSALQALQLEITKETHKTDVIQLMGKYTDGRTLWIDIYLLSPALSRIAVRVGMKGEEEASRKIVDKILGYL